MNHRKLALFAGSIVAVSTLLSVSASGTALAAPASKAGCPTGGGWSLERAVGSPFDKNGDNVVCVKIRNGQDPLFKDNNNPG
jgi:hypothetical protein